jgi:3-oxoacyl-[acyl-carrier protein] reductase
MGVALVTGVSRRVGIGAAVARRLAEAGLDLFLHSWSPHDAQQPWGADAEGPAAIVADLRARVRVEHLAADLADPDAPARILAAAERAFGRVDVLVANHARSSTSTLEELTAAELDLSYAVNTRATLLLVKEFAARCPGPDGWCS